MRRRLKVYLAGPDVFLPDSVVIGERKKQLCTKYGFKGLYPFDNELLPSDSERTDALIFRANMAMIHQADLGVVNLTPFRGPSADAGTVFELGVMVGLGKPVFAYTNEADDLLERIRRTSSAQFDSVSNVWRDVNGMAIEDFGNADNLMIDQALALQGHPIVRNRTHADDVFRDLGGFETCLRLAAGSPNEQALTQPGPSGTARRGRPVRMRTAATAERA